MRLPDDFYKNVENINYLNHVLYSDTDSVYLKIPHPKEDSLENKWKRSIEVSEIINNTIINYLKDYIFKLANITPDKNQTFFKTEGLMGGIGFLPDVKKYYTYQLLVDEGKFLEKPKIKYKNISIKSNLAKMSTDMIQDIINNIILNNNILKDQKLNLIHERINQWGKYYKDLISKYDFSEIGIPNKWSKSTQIINAMKAYNIIMEKEIFVHGSAGKYIYCNFKMTHPFMMDKSIDIKNLNSLAIPYTYDSELLRQKMTKYQIEVDSAKHWDKCIMTTTCQKLLEMLK